MPYSKATSDKKPTPEEVQKAMEKAAAKLAKQIEDDQAWLDANLCKLTPSEQDELLRQASKKCKDTKKVGDDIVVGCPLPRKLQYCVEADEFKCPSGQVRSAKGCKLSDAVTQSLRTEESCVDGQFVSEAEGGSYMSPYVPWGQSGWGWPRTMKWRENPQGRLTPAGSERSGALKPGAGSTCTLQSVSPMNRNRSVSGSPDSSKENDPVE